MVRGHSGIRADWRVDPHKNIDAILKTSDAKAQKLLKENSNIIKRLSKIENLSIDKSAKRPTNAASGVVEAIEFYIPLINIIDIPKEKNRINSQIQNQIKVLFDINKRLKNRQFLKKAPCEIVDKEKNRQEELKQNINKLKKIIKELK